MQRTRFFIVGLVMMTACVTSLPAISAESNGIRIPSVTRWVYIFSRLEYKLSEAVKQRDSKTIDNLLDRHFEMRVGAMPGNPIPRATWIRQALAEPKLASSFEQMAVHAYAKLAIVSFLWTVKPQGQTGAPRPIYVVDTWRQVQGDWKLAVRYAAPGGKSKITVPAGTLVAPAFEKKE